jgi:thiol:disulfide interchange protein
MKKIFLPILLILSVIIANAQDSLKKVDWKFGIEKKGDKQYSIQLNGTIDPGWKLVTTQTTEAGLNTAINFDSTSQKFLKIGTALEGAGLKTEKVAALDNAEVKYFENTVSITIPVTVTDTLQRIRGTITPFVYKGEEFLNSHEMAFLFKVNDKGELESAEAGLQTSGTDNEKILRKNIDINNPVNGCGGIGGVEKKGIFTVFLLGLLGGLFALIMPCVFPLIPMTVSYFTKGGQDRKKGIRNAALYGFFIFLVYILVSVPFHIFSNLNPQMFNNISTNVWLNLVFFAIFIFFAFSLFGYYELSLPSSIASKADSKSGLGIGGIFFMALTLAIVSFSCTGPIVGLLLVNAIDGADGAWKLTSGMAGFGVGLGLPFAIFAMFPNMLKSLPKSGGWLNTIKVVFGFIELAFAFKFLANADNVEQWGFMKRELFIGLWVIISLLTAAYLFGWIRFPHDNPKEKKTKTRIAFGLVFALISLYLIPGLTNTKYANLKLISGFPPPLNYSVYGKHKALEHAVEPDVINDYEKALRLAKEKNKPLMIDFTGWACVNCRKMEEQVWPDPEVAKQIKDNYILVSLYVDEKRKLPEEEQFIYTDKLGAKKEITSVGDKYANLQITNFNATSQPYYVLVSPDEKLLALPIAYTSSAKEYADWLKCGVQSFNKIKAGQ